MPEHPANIRRKNSTQTDSSICSQEVAQQAISTTGFGFETPRSRRSDCNSPQRQTRGHGDINCCTRNKCSDICIYGSTDDHLSLGVPYVFWCSLKNPIRTIEHARLLE